MSTENLINYISSKISDQFFKKYIKNKNINVDYNKIYNVNFEDILKKIRKKINKRGGTLLSNTYLGSTHPLDIRCAKGHLFKLLSYKILNGVWCQQCLGVGITLNDLKKIALARGGKCLSLSYKNPNTKMKWECAKGHRWEAISCSVRNMKTWCPMCAGKKVINKKILQTIAKSHGGKLLSRIFKSSIDCYRFECKLGHIWKAKAGKVVNRGQWCRKCALIKNGIKRREKTLSLIKLTAKRKGGTCLSKKFLGTNSTLKFECKNSHLFKLPYWKFKRNHWCPQCLL